MMKIMARTIIIATCVLEFQHIHAVMCWTKILERDIDAISKAEAKFLKKHPQTRLHMHQEGPEDNRLFHVEGPDLYISAINDTGYNRNEIQVRVIKKEGSPDNELAFKVFKNVGFAKDQEGLIHRRVSTFSLNIRSQELYNAIKNAFASYSYNFTTVVSTSHPIDWTDNLYNLIVQTLRETLDIMEERYARDRMIDRYGHPYMPE